MRPNSCFWRIFKTDADGVMIGIAELEFLKVITSTSWKTRKKRPFLGGLKYFLVILQMKIS